MTNFAFLSSFFLASEHHASTSEAASAGVRRRPARLGRRLSGGTGWGLMAAALALWFAAACPPAAAEQPPASSSSSQGGASASSSTEKADQPPIRGLQGMWVWSDKWINTPQAQDRLLAFCKKYGFNQIQVQIHLARDRDQGKPSLKHPRLWRRLLDQAADKHIRVEALDGAPKMADEAHRPAALAELKMIIDFNQGRPQGRRFAGMHYDIEPYTHGMKTAWDDPAKRPAIMRDVLSFYAKVGQIIKQRGSSMTLAADIPMWYDNKTAPDDNCVVTFRGQKKNFYKHIEDLCDYVGVMSYRRKAVGHNSVVKMVANEMHYAAEIGKTVCPSLETIQLKDVPQITFYGTSPREFWKQERLVVRTLGDNPGFGGMLLHDYRGLRDLMEKKESK